MARAAGVPCLGVAYGARARAALIGYAPLACVEDFASLRPWLQRNA